jgi:hypothetical protein
MEMIGIIAKLVMDIEVKQQTGCEAHRKTEDVDQRKCLLPQQAAGGYFQVAGWHISVS